MEINAQRKNAYEKKQQELKKYCANCKSPSVEHCEYGCNIGRKLRYLEAEDADVTGWTHELWGRYNK